MSKRARKKVEGFIQLVSVSSFDSEKLCRHVNGLDGCKRLLEDSKNEVLAAKVCAKQLVRNERGSSVQGLFLYKKDVLMVLLRRTTVGLSQHVFFSSQNVRENVGHPVLLCTSVIQRTDYGRERWGQQEKPSGEIVKARNCRGRLLV